jgi:thioredoxin reductase
MPDLPGIRAFYGTSIHSCVECDGWEHRDQPLAVIGETDDLAERGMLVSQWSDDVIVFTNGVGHVSGDDEADLARRGVRVDRRPLADVEGDRTGLTGIRTADGDVVARSAAFVRPVYTPVLAWAAGLDLATDALGFVEVDPDGRTSADGVYAVGDATVSGPRQLIVSAGQGARVASTVNRDLLRASLPTAQADLVAFEDAPQMR